MLQFILTIILFRSIFIQSKEHWSYDNPKTWSHDYHYCGGNSQSPINLKFNISFFDHRLRYIYFEEKGPHEPPQLVNNGYTVQLNLKNHYILKHVAPQSEDYKVEQIHFHWGHLHDYTTGSEHFLEGRSYPLEMHVVTYSNYFSNIAEAVTNTRALAVVGVFFELSNEPNEYLQPIINATKYIRNKGDQIVLTEDFNLKALIGEKRMRRYYRYDGSLTTPPCYESVIWSVLQEPLYISSKQLQVFHSLHDKNFKLMNNTYRPIQPIGKRILFRSFHPKDAIDDDSKDRMGSNGNIINLKIISIFISILIINL